MEPVGPLQVAASLVLVAVAWLVGWLLELRIGRRLLIAVVRATVQLVAIGYLMTWVFQSAGAMVLAWIWVAAMLAITAMVARRRAPDIPDAGLVAAAACGFTVLLSLAVVFPLRVLAYDPVNVVVVAGITVGNTLSAQVLGAKLLTELFRDRRGEVEALVALGLSRMQIVRCVAGPIVSTALLPQIERTNVVGLISLPGAMTGLLLAGADPLDAVLVQLIVMFLVLGAVATAVAMTVVLGITRLFYPDNRPRQVDHRSR